VPEEVGIYISLPIRRNHIGKMWIPPSLSSVAKFAIIVFERRSSISAELRIGGLVAEASDMRPVISHTNDKHSHAGSLSTNT